MEKKHFCEARLPLSSKICLILLTSLETHTTSTDNNTGHHFSRVIRDL